MGGRPARAKNAGVCIIPKYKGHWSTYLIGEQEKYFHSGKRSRVCVLVLYASLSI